MIMKEAYFNDLTYSSNPLYEASKDIAQQKKAATGILNGLIKLRDQISEYTTQEEDNALLQAIKLAEEVRDVRQVAASSAKQNEKKAQAKAARIEAGMKKKIEQRLFGECSNEEQVIAVANAFVEFTQDMDMKPFLSQYHSLRENQAQIIDAIYDDQYIKEFKFDAFEAYCDQRLAEAEYTPIMANRSDDAAENFSL
ncbi:MAG: hypothetical protein JAY75_23030 [Candidatus Thiodiazotropha taylori]|nr:hypothetical protein [Candidatus Thiodiazotropha taylori]MCG8095375.1 hypothetical protein [Candidatus Thiodiazotropha endolucinida]MCG7882929.1 hypothetical protein [Candidatus Thiodiazotropha taylori]MCG7888549.1 hypothetical protein [Candidatus Thiodiazotropha taylori]MCG7892257.1 hypothetical protein [Candidatus Thiodiazotropha taylori]